jgi:hypothetical protein
LRIPHALIVAPTRELALQIATVIREVCAAVAEICNKSGSKTTGIPEDDDEAGGKSDSEKEQEDEGDDDDDNEVSDVSDNEDNSRSDRIELVNNSSQRSMSRKARVKAAALANTAKQTASKGQDITSKGKGKKNKKNKKNNGSGNNQASTGSGGIKVSIEVVSIVGGMSEQKQRRQLAGRGKPVHIVVATPGRLCEMFEDTDNVSFQDMSQLKFLVVDEADRIMEDGHYPEVSKQDLT